MTTSERPEPEEREPDILPDEGWPPQRCSHCAELITGPYSVCMGCEAVFCSDCEDHLLSNEGECPDCSKEDVRACISCNKDTTESRMQGNVCLSCAEN